MSKHTPGPWKIRKHWANDDAFEVYPDKKLVGYGQLAAIVEVGDSCYEDEAEANAQLIAATPEMLDALKLVIVIAKAALAKAEGNDATTE